MIIVRMVGGLGNQMFQYAIGRKIAHEKDLPLKLDISAFEDYKRRSFELVKYRINADVATPQDIARFRSEDALRRKLQRLYSLIIPFSKKRIIKENDFVYDARMERVGDLVYLDGYWQSEKYFKSIDGLIRKELVLKDAPDNENSVMATQIKAVNAVALHIRRGDYVTNPEANAYHGVCSLEYYRNAMEKITERINDPYFFIFSDDPGWVLDNLKIDGRFQVVSNNSVESGCEDMRLMSMCKHFIIANSSFSWWGAWLSENRNKIVMAPGKWFRDPGIDTSDLLPQSWIRI